MFPYQPSGVASEHEDWVESVTDELLGSGEGLHEPRGGDASGPLEPMRGGVAGSKDLAISKTVDAAEGGAGTP